MSGESSSSQPDASEWFARLSRHSCGLKAVWHCSWHIAKNAKNSSFISATYQCGGSSELFCFPGGKFPPSPQSSDAFQDVTDRTAVLGGSHSPHTTALPQVLLCFVLWSQSSQGPTAALWSVAVLSSRGAATPSSSWLCLQGGTWAAGAHRGAMQGPLLHVMGWVALNLRNWPKDLQQLNQINWEVEFLCVLEALQKWHSSLWFGWGFYKPVCIVQWGLCGSVPTAASLVKHLLSSGGIHEASFIPCSV